MMSKRIPVKNTQPPSAFSQFTSRFTTEQMIIAAMLLATVVIVAAIGISTIGNQQVEIEGLVYTPGLPQGHQENATYPNSRTLPPLGGIHNPVWQNCGVYSSVLSIENAVHSLEHGAVWITYNPSLAADQVARLQDITRGGSHRLLSPYPELESPIVLTAWGYQLKLDSVDDGRLMAFINNYEQGPQTPEPGASCNRGIGQPLS
jgi:hypothetical protein